MRSKNYITWQRGLINFTSLGFDSGTSGMKVRVPYRWDTKPGQPTKHVLYKPIGTQWTHSFTFYVLKIEIFRKNPEMVWNNQKWTTLSSENGKECQKSNESSNWILLYSCQCAIKCVLRVTNVENDQPPSYAWLPPKMIYFQFTCDSTQFWSTFGFSIFQQSVLEYFTLFRWF